MANVCRRPNIYSIGDRSSSRMQARIPSGTTYKPYTTRSIIQSLSQGNKTCGPGECGTAPGSTPQPLFRHLGRLLKIPSRQLAFPDRYIKMAGSLSRHHNKIPKHVGTPWSALQIGASFNHPAGPSCGDVNLTIRAGIIAMAPANRICYRFNIFITNRAI